MRPLQAIAITFLMGCGHVQIDRAVSAHNIYRRMLVEASDAFTPIYAAAASGAMHNEEEVDYEREMEPYNGVVRALRSGQEAEQVIHVALEHCIAMNDGTCDLAGIGFACAATALDLLSESFGQVQGGASLFAASAVLEMQLRELASGAACEAK
jgi:hypothetical protein